MQLISCNEEIRSRFSKFLDIIIRPSFHKIDRTALLEVVFAYLLQKGHGAKQWHGTDFFIFYFFKSQSVFTRASLINQQGNIIS